MEGVYKGVKTADNKSLGNLDITKRSPQPLYSINTKQVYLTFLLDIFLKKKDS